MRRAIADLLLVRRLLHDDVHEEPVALRLGQRVHALGLDRVLRGEHEERRRAAAGSCPPIETWRSAIASSSADCTLAGARLISSASTMLANTGPHSMSKSSRRRAPDAGADEVGGHEVRRELEPGERAAHDLRQRRHGQRLGQAGHALDQAVAVGEQAQHDPLDQAVLADDDALDLEQRVLEQRCVLGARDACREGPVGCR